jgi:hypothetical protein
MYLRKLGPTKLEIETITGNIVFYSYNTPVAACLSDGRGFIRTNKRYSVTTSKHINQWLNGAKAVEVEQGVINRLVGL